jgi:uncharacterized protein (UPF0305 family)
MLSIGMNRKLKAGNIAAYNLPARKDICGRECVGCYAKKAQKMYKAVTPYRERNYQASLLPGFATDMVAEIKGLKKKPKAIRIHESGDFYSQAYVDSWAMIALALPGTVFYAYTKRNKEFDFSVLSAQPNFVLIDSCKYHPVNYGDPGFVQVLKAHGAFVCPADKVISCGAGCDYCLTKAAQLSSVVFNKH